MRKRQDFNLFLTRQNHLDLTDSAPEISDMNSIIHHNLIKLIRLLLILGLIAAISSETVFSQTPVETVISNQAQTFYTDADNREYKALSQIVSIKVTAVYSLAVTPDEIASTANVAQLTKITRHFTINNQGNTANSYIVSNLSVTSPAIINDLYFDTDNSHTITAADQKINVNSTVSPVIEPGKSIDVVAVLEVNNAAPDSLIDISLTAKSTNSNQEDSGRIINKVAPPITFTDLDDPSAKPRIYINGQRQVRVSNGEIITYEIKLRNRSSISADKIVVADDLPAEVDYVPGTLRLNGVNLSDDKDGDNGSITNKELQIELAKVEPNEIVVISYQARIKALKRNSKIANTARIWGENISLIETAEALALVDPYAVVFAARSEGRNLISNAQVTLLDETGSTPISLSPSLGFAPNANNQNSFTTVNDGRYAFNLSNEQLGATGGKVSYALRVAASGYQSRLIAVTITPDSHRGFYNAVLKSLDGQRLAEDGSFTLTNNQVAVNNFASVSFNIPLFEDTNLVVQKTADRPNAEIGDIITYQVNIQNATRSDLDNLVVRDQLPAGLIYVAGTAKLQQDSSLWKSVEPEVVDGSKLVFRFAAINLGERAALTYRVRVGANTQPGASVNSVIAEGVFPNGEKTTTQPAQAVVRITNGTFSTRQAVIGRVYSDKNDNGVFDAGDIPIAGARLYTQKGQAVITDSEGMYNFPSLEDGAIVLRLDPITLPFGLTVAKGANNADKGFERILQTPLLGGTLLQQNFALRPIAESKKQQTSDTEFSETKAKKTNQPQIETTEETTAEISAESVDKATKETPAAEEIDKTVAESKTGVSKKVESEKSDEPNPETKSDEPKKAGKYTIESKETVQPVEAGKIEIVSPKADQVIMASALELEARVAAGWSIDLAVNGVSIDKEHIGTFKQFHVMKVDSFTFVGVNLKAGANKIVAAAVGPDGKPGEKKELTVMGRGPVKRLEIISERDKLRANGRDETEVTVRALDEWGNPALDNQVALTLSQGNIVLPGEKVTTTYETVKFNSGDRNIVNLNAQIAPNNEKRQHLLSLEKGRGTVKIIAGNSPGNSEITAVAGASESKFALSYLPDLRPSMMVGIARASFGKANPELALRGKNSSFHSRIGFFYSGTIFKKNLLTLSYDSERALNRTNGRDRQFELDPLDRVYPVFGDSSTRFESAMSNSKLYARIDRGNSYAMFGDFETGMNNLQLAGYSRKLTGAKIHLQNSKGDFISVTGARPDTSFSRDVFPGNQLGLVRLSNPDVLQGSEVVTLETRDRRNPENVISREQLIRSVDYNLDIYSGQLYFLRPLMAFDINLNLVQVVITYEHFSNNNKSNIYTGRAAKNFQKLGLKLGLSAINQRQETLGSYLIGGLDGEKTTFGGGKIKFDYALSRGKFAADDNLFNSTDLLSDGNERHDGNAVQIELEQPLKYKKSILRAKFARSDRNFYNPFGAGVAPGSQNVAAGIEMKPRAASQLRLGFTDERNSTENVDNKRLTFSSDWTEQVRSDLRLRFGYDFRKFNDSLSNSEINSSLVTVGAEWRPTEKFELAVKREQNLGEADPTYPNQTTFAAKYKLNNLTNVFFTQRLASDAIRPISDVSTLGFASTSARSETAFGVESKMGRFSTLSGRYQIENGANGTDSFAVVGLQNSLPINKKSSVEFGYERGFHIAGAQKSFNTALIGYSWKAENFKSSVRYELRDRAGFGSILTGGAAGKIGDNITVLGRMQYASGKFNDQRNKSIQGTAALAYRPLTSGKVALLFSYNTRSTDLSNSKTLNITRDRVDTLSTDGLWQASKRLEFYSHAAVKFLENGRPDVAKVSAMTFLVQNRAQYKLFEKWDVAAETRFLAQPSTATARLSAGAELGFWIMPDIRLGGGYNLTKTYQPTAFNTADFQKKGFYFNITTKLSRIFNLFGSKDKDEEPETPRRNIAKTAQAKQN